MYKYILYIYIYIYIWSIENILQPWVSWSFFQNNNHQAFKKIEWIENWQTVWISFVYGCKHVSVCGCVHMHVCVIVTYGCVFLWG